MSRRGPPLEIPPYALHVRRADALMGMGKAEAALDEARRAIELEPERAEAWFEAARALLADCDRRTRLARKRARKT